MAGKHQDAILIVELSKLGAMAGVPAAGRTILADGFDADAVEIDDPSVSVVLGFFETVAMLVKNDLLNRDLVHDWVWVAGLWERVGPAAKRARAKMGADVLFENFEALAADQAQSRVAGGIEHELARS